VVAGRAVGELEDAHVGVSLACAGLARLRAAGQRSARLAADAHGHLLGPDLGGLGVWARFAGVLRPSTPGVKGSCGSEPSASEDGTGLVGAAIVRDINQ